MTDKSKFDLAIEGLLDLATDLDDHVVGMTAEEAASMIREFTEDIEVAHKSRGDAMDSMINHIDELRCALSDALNMFKWTQRVEDYPDGHWSKRAEQMAGGYTV